MTYRVEHLAEGVTVYLGDNREIIPQVGSFDVCLTDPPYGCNKAAWDGEFPVDWFGLVAADRTVVITGSAGLRDSVRLVGDRFVDVIAARNMNGMTRGPMGFGNWLAAVVSGSRPRQGINAFDFSVSADMPDHPSPKPLPYMLKLVERVTDIGDSILDPFCGSGTTGVAAVRLCRSFTGIEIDERHFDLSCRRIADELRRPRLFTERPSPAVQGALFS